MLVEGPVEPTIGVDDGSITTCTWKCHGVQMLNNKLAIEPSGLVSSLWKVGADVVEGCVGAGAGRVEVCVGVGVGRGVMGVIGVEPGSPSPWRKLCGSTNSVAQALL